jgi:alpha-L-fucosidase
MAKKQVAKSAANEQVPVASMKGDTSWFVHDRFGMFIHWGLYALLARHEWVKHREKLTNEQYRKYFDVFYPDLYNPREWARAAARAGMKYFVITTKHHEGFCLWNSKYTDYNAAKTPWGKDLLKPMVEAFREEGIRIGFYYSLLDWHHADFPIDKMHPQREDKAAREREKGRDVSKYAAYMRNQVTELLTQFGQVDVLWFDFSYPGEDGKGRNDWESEELARVVRKLQPKVIVDDRLDLPGFGDIATPEQFQPRTWVTREGQRVTWEACQTFSGSWGYHRDEQSWRDTGELIRTLIDCVSKGGNLLLNVGPTARGEIDYRAMERLNGIGEWMRRHSRSIYGCTEAPAEFPCPRDCRLTYNPATKRIYVHILAWPYKQLCLDGFAGKVAYAQLLHDASEVAMKGVESWQLERAKEAGYREDTLTLTLPQTPPNVTVPVVELFLK